MPSQLSAITKTIRTHANPERAAFSQRFFRTAPGQYGHGDIFLGGLTVPQQRLIAKQFAELPWSDLQSLITSKYHEERAIALFILCTQYAQATRQKDLKTQQKIVKFYLASTAHINNWDLVDLSCYKILGHYLYFTPALAEKTLLKLAHSKSLWEKRIAMVSMYFFIKQKSFALPLKIAEILLHDPHDLMHKAVGWMLRELGKQDVATLDKFLKKHYQTMPRTALRYAIEKHSPTIRQKYLKGKI
ncbi:MAG: DNA alkylation repair protein [Candidatus Altimarinota bacterium]